MAGMEQQDRLYHRRRERAERKAASTASSPVAKRVHQQLATHYADLFERAEAPPRSHDQQVGLPGLVILSRD